MSQLSCIYRPPCGDYDISLDLLSNHFTDICNSFHKCKFIITGDFNLPTINWSMGRPFSSTESDLPSG